MCVELLKKMFMELLISVVKASIHTKCVSLSNHKCMIRSTLIHLNPNESGQEFHYSPFPVKLHRCVGSCNTLNHFSNKVCVPNKTEDLILGMFNMITGINASKTVVKHTSCECKYRFDGRKCNSDQWWNNDKCRCECKKRHVCEKDYVWNPATCNCENGKYLASIMDDSVITCDEITESHKEETKHISTNFNEKKLTCKTHKF